MNPFMMSYSVYEIERRAAEARQRETEASIARLAAMFVGLCGLVRRVTAKVAMRRGGDLVAAKHAQGSAA